MKRISLLLAIALFAAGHIYGQMQRPDELFEDWGKVTMEEMNMKSCSFEKDADAMLLLDMGEVYYHIGGNNSYFYSGGKKKITTAYYQRYKIFTEKGTSQANMSMTTNKNDNEEVKNIRAICYHLVDGVIKKEILMAHDIHETELSAHQTKTSFSIPAVAAGCVFEIYYEKEQDLTSTLPKWFFTSDVPSVKSSLKVRFLDAIEYHVVKHMLQDTIQQTSKSYQSDIPSNSMMSQGSGTLSGHAITYTVYNLRSYHIETYTGSSRDNMQWIGFQLEAYVAPLTISNAHIISSFERLSSEVFTYPLLKENMERNPIPKKQWATVLRDDMTSEQKTRAIYDYIRTNVKWNGNGGVVPSSPNALIWKNKTGSWADIAGLLICALFDENIDAYPMIVGSRRNGVMNQEYPILDDYEGLDVLVKLRDGRSIILDPTDRNLPYGEPDVPQINTVGMVITAPRKYEWYPIYDYNPSHEDVIIKADVDESGKLTGTAVMTYTNHSGEYLIKQHKRANESSVSEYIKGEMPGATIESVKDSLDEEKSTFTCTVKFSSQVATDNDGNIYIPMTAAFGGTTSPFISRERIADVDFGYRSKTSVKMVINVPEGYTVDPVPGEVAQSMKDTSLTFACGMEVKGKTVELHQVLDYNRFLIPVAKFAELYELEKKYYDAKQRPVMLRKKG